MKTKILMPMGLCVAIGFMSLASTGSFANEEKEGKMEIPSTIKGIFMEIHEHHMELAETVKDKKLDDVHHHAFAIRDLANALPAKATADKLKQVEGTVKNIAKLASGLDESGDNNNQAQTEANLKKLDGMLKILDAQFGMKMDGKEAHQHQHK